MKICILNASNPTTKTLHLESDSYVSYLDGRAACYENNKPVKQIRSWHFWAYACETEFFVHGKDKWTDCFKYDGVIILVKRDIDQVIPLVKKLKLMKKKVAISLHEGLGDFFGGSGINNENMTQRWKDMVAIVKEADVYLNIFGQLQSYFIGIFGEEKVKFANHGCDITWDHKLTIPFDEREYDILIGSRTLHQRLPRNTLLAIGVANIFAKQGKKVLYVSEDGDIRKLFDDLGFTKIDTKTGPFSYEEWLKVCANSKICIHADYSLNLGQIVFDCSMVDTVCLGSNCWNNVRINTDDCGKTDNLESLIKLHLAAPELYRQENSPFSKFKKNIHPDIIKEELQAIWQ